MAESTPLDAITAARIELLLNHPFFGTLALYLKPQEGELWCGSAATDGRCLYYDSSFVSTLSREECVFLVAHEVMHCALGHLWRRGDRDRERWNVAIDLTVNTALVDAGLTMPAGGLYDAKLRNKSAEEVYARLPDTVYRSPFDMHLESSDRIGTPQPGSAHAKAAWALRARQALTAAKGNGEVPAGLERLIGASCRAQVDWRSLLAMFIIRNARNDYTWFPPNRRFLGRGFILPSLRSQMGDVVVGLDTSGSISQSDLDAFVAEIRSISAMLPVRLTLMACDAEVQEVLSFDMHESVNVPAVRGGGGTDFKPVFDRVEREGMDPTCLVYLTDGLGTYPTEPAPYPVLWVIRRPFSDQQQTWAAATPPWGMVVTVEYEPATGMGSAERRASSSPYP